MNLRNLKSSRMFAASLAAMLVLTLTVAAVPTQAQTYTILDNFLTGGPGPQWPGGPLAVGRDGNLYGDSYLGGTNNTGSIWKTDPLGTVSVVYSFATGTGNDCQTGMTLGTDGNFYGSALTNCTGAGYIFKLTTSGTLTVLHTFTGTPDGYGPGSLVQYTDGNFYGTTAQGGANNAGSVFKITPAGTLTTIYSFPGTNNFSNPTYSLTIGADGNFYGTQVGGDGKGSIYKITSSGVLTVLHTFIDNPDGAGPVSGVILGKDGNFYGVTQFGGTNSDGRVGEGTFFKMTPAGIVTILHSFNPATDYAVFPTTPLLQATDGNFYSTSNACNEFLSCGQFVDIYKITPTGTLTVVEELTGPNGTGAYWPLTQDTNGIIYGVAQQGGTTNGGVLFTENIGAAPFINLQSTSGKVGSKVGIFGQGFSGSSVVKFNGAQATTVTLTGTTYLTATVPTGATSGKVTVTTGSTTLTSTQTFTVHNSWASGAVMPTATAQSSAAVLGGSIYVIGGANTSGTVIANVQVYNPTTNTWSTGTPLPTVTQHSSAAVVNNILYVFGGDNGVTAPTNAVWAYSTKTKSWTSMAPMLTARNGTLAVVEKNIVYVIGGNLGNGANFVATVESYNPATNTWTAETPMAGAKDYAAGGLLGTTIVAADGAVASGQITGDTEGYNATTNAWSELAADPTARTGSCSGVISSALYDTGGYINNNGAATTVNESYSLSANKWTTTLLSIPQGTMYAAPAVDNGQLYCFGGWATLSGTAINNVQIYQP
jgi:uncharacterized repeat protein (TIGR03803 family)